MRRAWIGREARPGTSGLYSSTCISVLRGVPLSPHGHSPSIGSPPRPAIRDGMRACHPPRTKAAPQKHTIVSSVSQYVRAKPARTAPWGYARYYVLQAVASLGSIRPLDTPRTAKATTRKIK